MEFRRRNYIAEAESHALHRVSADNHPLKISSPPQRHQSHDDAVERADVEFVDPLRAPDSRASVSIDDPLDIESSSSSSAAQIPTQERAALKRLLMQRFPASKMITISPISDAIMKGSKASEISSSVHREDFDDAERSFEEGVKTITRQEYVSRLHELKEEITRAWHAHDRVTSLKISIKIARLLMDTSLLQFYPTLFILATDVIDMMGEMVWERIKHKAEIAEDGNRLCSLSDSFKASDICSDAKETCTNWFSRVGSIRELLPRIYMELSILPCWRFLLDHPEEIVQRLVMMTRGIGDPLASIYCRLYMVHCAQKLPSGDLAGYLITCINDIQKLLKRPISSKENIPGYFEDNKRLLVSLIEPAIEYIMKCIFKDISQREVDRVVMELGLGTSQVNLFECSPCVSIVLHHLLKELPSEIVSANAVKILKLIECSNDYSFDQCLNYRLLGLRLCERRCQMDVYNAVIEQVIQVVNQNDCLDDYLKIVDAYIDVMLQDQLDNFLQMTLRGISERACGKGIPDNELAGLQSILLKVLSNFQCVGDIFSQSHFLEILDVMYGSSRNIINMNILNMATRDGQICDSAAIQFLFEISKSLHDSIDYANMKDVDSQQPSLLICHFIHKVDFGADLEHHLTFLLECRGAFGSINEVQEIIVHSSNSLAVKALKGDKRNTSFVKSCIACSEVTIPAIASLTRQLNLYLETAEVSLLASLLSHAEGLLDSALSCIQNLVSKDGMRNLYDLDGTLSLVQKFCSILVIIPGNPKQGVTDIPSNLLSLIDSQSWLSPKMKMRTYCAIVSLCATLSQTKLPYHSGSAEVAGNDVLFFNDQSYLNEFLSLSDHVLKKLVLVIQQEPSKAARGTMALEACNSIASTLKINDEVISLCSKLMEIAKSCMTPGDRYLQSTVKFLDRVYPSSANVVPSVSM